MRCLTIHLYGRVQGVNLRRSAQAAARNLGLVGKANNRHDGSVEIVAEGEESALESFLEWVQRGSILANVEHFSYRWGPATGQFDDFSVVRSGSLVLDQLRAFRNLGRRILGPDPATRPCHVAVIPDGNRRWAEERGLPAVEGHRRGLEKVKELAKSARELRISVLTIWGFSTENWAREESERTALFSLFRRGIESLGSELHAQRIAFGHLGRRDRLPSDVLLAMQELERSTAHFENGRLNLALDYGGRDELLRGIRSIIRDGVSEDELDEAKLSSYLDTKDGPDPDLVIRTSGEHRLSGILPWQSVYSELYFTPLHFPDFGVEAFRLALMDYARRKRRFGR